ncbi:hypothetical protein P9112_007537 [Eukaryota sp. TZLM1-RC]
MPNNLLDELCTKFRIVASDGSAMRVPRSSPELFDDCCYSYKLGEWEATTGSIASSEGLLESFRRGFPDETSTRNTHSSLSLHSNLSVHSVQMYQSVYNHPTHPPFLPLSHSDPNLKVHFPSYSHIPPPLVHHHRPSPTSHSSSSLQLPTFLHPPPISPPGYPQSQPYPLVGPPLVPRSSSDPTLPLSRSGSLRFSLSDLDIGKRRSSRIEVRDIIN